MISQIISFYLLYSVTTFTGEITHSINSAIDTCAISLALFSRHEPPRSRFKPKIFFSKFLLLF